MGVIEARVYMNWTTMKMTFVFGLSESNISPSRITPRVRNITCTHKIQDTGSDQGCEILGHIQAHTLVLGCIGS